LPTSKYKPASGKWDCIRNTRKIVARMIAPPAPRR
jgi:hypothetical protein